MVERRLGFQTYAKLEKDIVCVRGGGYPLLPVLATVPLSGFIFSSHPPLLGVSQAWLQLQAHVASHSVKPANHILTTLPQDLLSCE